VQYILRRILHFFVCGGSEWRTMRIELHDMHKHYGSIKANNGINLTVEEGTIHGILGENGAGKSTLMKVLAGYIPKTSGKIIIDGEVQDYHTPAEASRRGIGMLYQEPLDYPPLSVLENFMIGQAEGVSNKTLHFREKLEELITHFNFTLDPDVRVKSLTVGERQQLEMLRLLSLGIEVLILDEPTTGISDLQKEALFNSLRRLASEGKSVILVSHKLKDSEALCDRVTVLREGEVTGSMEKPYDANELLSMMFGEPPLPSTRSPVEYGGTVLSMKNISGLGERTGLSRCTIDIREGEMIGLAGLEGSGQGVFLRIAAGITKPTEGSLSFFGDNMIGKNLHAFKKEGVVFLPASRLEEGLMPDLSIQEHFALKEGVSSFFVKWNDAREESREKTEKFRVKGTPDTIAEALSGGNQQRLMLSLLSKESTLLLLEQPTRGLDVESANWVWWHLSKYCLRKTGIIFSSTDLDEIMSIADRILVFFDGTIIKDVKRDKTDARELAKAIAGKV
jgi:ABC-type uncharacterized transport system ATPase subunit